uniref:Secreted protein n=1 Tax=Rhizophora mucronata TaxID=61149 RepID=A0A2P2P311_RHIMU
MCCIISHVIGFLLKVTVSAFQSFVEYHGSHGNTYNDNIDSKTLHSSHGETADEIMSAHATMHTDFHSNAHTNRMIGTHKRISFVILRQKQSQLDKRATSVY